MESLASGPSSILARATAMHRKSVSSVSLPAAFASAASNAAAHASSSMQLDGDFDIIKQLEAIFKMCQDAASTAAAAYNSNASNNSTGNVPTSMPTRSATSVSDQSQLLTTLAMTDDLHQSQSHVGNSIVSTSATTTSSFASDVGVAGTPLPMAAAVPSLLPLPNTFPPTQQFFDDAARVAASIHTQFIDQAEAAARAMDWWIECATMRKNEVAHKFYDTIRRIEDLYTDELAKMQLFRAKVDEAVKRFDSAWGFNMAAGNNTMPRLQKIGGDINNADSRATSSALSIDTRSSDSIGSIRLRQPLALIKRGGGGIDSAKSMSPALEPVSTSTSRQYQIRTPTIASTLNSDGLGIGLPPISRKGSVIPDDCESDAFPSDVEDDWFDIINADDRASTPCPTNGTLTASSTSVNIRDESTGQIDSVLAAAALSQQLIVPHSVVRSRAIYYGRRRLLFYDELPKPWRDNPHVTSGYRYLNSMYQCMRSILQIHNETLNIWTHLLPFFVFFAILVRELVWLWSNTSHEQIQYYFNAMEAGFEGWWSFMGMPTVHLPNESNVNYGINNSSNPMSAAKAYLTAQSQDLMTELMVYGADRLFFVLFLGAACMCLLCSTIYHTFMCHCRKSIMRSCVTVDYIGISLLICASVGSVIYYGFYGRTLARTIYLSVVAFVAATGVVLPWYRWFDRSENRFARVAIFILMACSGAIPATHLTFIHGVIPMLYYTYPLLISLGSYLIGVFIYANQYPERIWPGKFDVIGHSHQLWHLAVVAGIYFHYWATWHFYEHRFLFHATISQP